MEINVMVIVAVVVLFVQSLVSVDGVTPSCYSGKAKKVKFGQYWIPKQHTEDMDRNGKLIMLDGPLTAAIKGYDHKTITMVDVNTYTKCLQEGTCLVKAPGVGGHGLRDMLLTKTTKSNTFQPLDMLNFPFGAGSYGTALRPFVSVSVDDLPKSTKLCVKELTDFVLPNAKKQKHNGCVVVEDNSSNNQHCGISWFTESFAFQYKMYKTLPQMVNANVCNCNILKYDSTI